MEGVQMSIFGVEETSWFRGQYPPSLIEAVAVHSVLERLGFSSEDIFFGIVNDRVLVVLKVGEKQLPICVGETELDTDEMNELWTKLTADWNEGTVTWEEKRELYDRSKVKAQAPRIALALRNAGFQYPKQ